MSTPWPDDGFVLVKHDGSAWVIVHQNGQQLDRNTDIGADDPAAARRWIRGQAIAHADATWPADPGEDSDMYALDGYDGQLVARPVGGFRHDERGWTLTDSTGHTTHVNADIPEDHHNDAVRWADEIHTSREDYRPTPEHGTTTGGRYFAYYPPADSGAA